MTKQPLLGNYDNLSIGANDEDYITPESVASLTNIILNETEAGTESMILLENTGMTTFEILGTVSVYQSAGKYYFGLNNCSSKIALRFEQNRLYIKNNSAEDVDIYLIPQGFMRV